MLSAWKSSDIRGHVKKPTGQNWNVYIKKMKGTSEWAPRVILALGEG